MKRLLTLLFLFFTLTALGQANEAGVDTSKIYQSEEQMPEFPKQYGNIYEFIARHTSYPDSALAHHVEGEVILRSVVERDGKVTHPEILKGLGYGCDEAALDAFKGMPDWEPGKVKGVPVRSYYTVPAFFKIKEESPTAAGPDTDNIAQLVNALKSSAANADTARDPELAFHSVESMPKFYGGMHRLLNYLAKHLTYPSMAKKEGISGTVYVQFIVDKEGYVTHVKLLKGIGGGCDEEAVRVIRNMPKWEPGKQNGKPVDVYYSIPINFQMQ